MSIEKVLDLIVEYGRLKESSGSHWANFANSHGRQDDKDAEETLEEIRTLLTEYVVEKKVMQPITNNITMTKKWFGSTAGAFQADSIEDAFLVAQKYGIEGPFSGPYNSYPEAVAKSLSVYGEKK